MKKIAIIGPYPLPYGGISIHIERVLDILDIEQRIKYDFYDESKMSLYRKRCLLFNGKYQKIKGLCRLFLTQYKVIHYHSDSSLIRIILCIYGFFGKNIYLHIHNLYLIDIVNEKSIKCWFLKSLFSNVNILSDNPKISQLVKTYYPKSIREIDAFLPPIYHVDSYEIFKQKFLTNMNIREQTLIISMVGLFRAYHHEDLYGFDIMISSLYELIKKYDIHLIASVNGIVDQYIYDQCMHQIEELNLENHITFIFDELPNICPLYLVSDIFVRPTNTDGNALSIKEAMWFETKTIASDCVPRPEGTILFKNRDAFSLMNVIDNEILNTDKRISIDQKIEIVQNKQFNNRLFEEIYYAEQ